MLVVLETRDGPSDIANISRFFTNDSVLKIHSAPTAVAQEWRQDSQSNACLWEQILKPFSVKHFKTCSGEVTCTILNKA